MSNSQPEESKTPPYNMYSFKVDGCLPVCSRSFSQEDAMEKVRQLWPRSTVVFVGKDMPAAFRNTMEPKAESKLAKRVPLGAPPVSPVGLSVVEKSIVDAYAGYS